MIRTVLAFVGVVAASAGMLRALDRMPVYLADHPRGVQHFATIRAVEARLGDGLLVPAYYPQAFAWPPSAIRLVAGPPPAVALKLAARTGDEPPLEIVQVFGEGPLPDRLLPGRRMESRPQAIGALAGTFSLVQHPDGSIWQELMWQEEGRLVAFRSRGPFAQLLRMARSVRKERL